MAFERTKAEWVRQNEQISKRTIWGWAWRIALVIAGIQLIVTYTTPEIERPGTQVTFRLDKSYPVYTPNYKHVFDVDMKAGDQGRIVEAVKGTCLVAGTEKLANGDMFATHVPCSELTVR